MSKLRAFARPAQLAASLLLFLTAALLMAETKPAHSEDALFVDSGQELTSIKGNLSNDVALGDVDGDNDLDAYVVQGQSLGPQGNTVWLNDGDGFFTESEQDLGAGVGLGVALGDLDGDGDLDAFLANDGPNQVWINQGGDQGGDEGLFADSGQTLGNARSYAVALGHLNGDTFLDAVAANSSLDTVQVWWNEGDGTFSAGPSLGQMEARDVALGDLDDDGDLDVALADGALGINRVYWNNWAASFNFTAGPTLSSGFSPVVAAVIAQLDADDAPDMAFIPGGDNAFWWNNQDGTFTAGQALGGFVDDAAVDDLDGDGDLDVFLASGFLGHQVWLNNGNRAFSDRGDELDSLNSQAVALGDLDGDGDPDAFVANSGPNKVWLNSSPGSAGRDWQMETVAVRGDSGLAPDLAMDANGLPHVSYVEHFPRKDGPDYRLMYARWDGLVWHTNQVATLIGVIEHTSIALDQANLPYIAYLDDQALTVTYRAGNSWQKDVVDSDADRWHDMVIDSSGVVQILYQDLVAGDPDFYLSHATGEPGFWSAIAIEAIGSFFNPGGPAVALGPGDVLNVAYMDTNPDDSNAVKYARFDGGWSSETIVDGLVAATRNPAIAVDAAGSAHIVYRDDGSALHYAYRGATAWQIEAVPVTGTDPTIALDNNGTLHLAFESSLDVAYARFAGGNWADVVLSRGEQPAMALDNAGQPHMVFYEPRYGNLSRIFQAPTWTTLAVDSTGAVGGASMALASAPAGQGKPEASYYNISAGLVEVAAWQEAPWADPGQWSLANVDFVADPAVDTSITVPGGPFGSSEALSYYDADSATLRWAAPVEGAWTSEAVDESGDAGRFNQLVDGRVIVYWDAANQQIKLAERATPEDPWQIHADTAAPTLDALSGYLSAARLKDGRIATSYYHGASGDLRLATWDGGGWADELIDSSGDTGQVSSLAADDASGEPTVAYYDATANAIKFAYRQAGSWHISTAVPNASAVTSISLVLRTNSRLYPLIAYTTSEGLYLATLSEAQWLLQQVDDGAGRDLATASLRLSNRRHIAYGASDGLHLAFTAETPNANLGAASFPPYNPLVPDVKCELGTGNGASASAATRRPLLALAVSLTDFDVFEGLTAVFSGTTGGQYYIDQYRQHAAELRQIALSDLGLMWDAYQVLQNFMPGLEALVTGNGDSVIVTQEMADQATGIWQRLAAAASPDLAGLIDYELVRHNDLQDFVGQSFQEWFVEISADPPQPWIYLPAVRSDAP